MWYFRCFFCSSIIFYNLKFLITNNTWYDITKLYFLWWQSTWSLKNNNKDEINAYFQRWRSIVNSSNLLHVLRLRSMIVWEVGCQYIGSFASIRLSIQFFPHDFMGIGIDWKFLARRDCTMGVQQYQGERIWCLWSDLNNKTCKMHHCQLFWFVIYSTST